MKKIIITITVCFLFFSLSAQNRDTKNIGAIATYHLSKNKSFSDSYKGGFSVGLSFNGEFYKNASDPGFISYDLRVLYTQMNNSIDFNGYYFAPNTMERINYNYKGSDKLNRIDLPLIFGFKIVENFRVLAGFQFSFNLDVNRSIDSQSSNVSLPSDFDPEFFGNEFKSMNSAPILGFSYDVNAFTLIATWSKDFGSYVKGNPTYNQMNNPIIGGEWSTESTNMITFGVRYNIFNL